MKSCTLVGVIDASPEGLREVDDRLIAVVSQLHASIAIMDINRNRVAEIQGVSLMCTSSPAPCVRWSSPERSFMSTFSPCPRTFSL